MPRFVLNQVRIMLISYICMGGFACVCVYMNAVCIPCRICMRVMLWLRVTVSILLSLLYPMQNSIQLFHKSVDVFVPTVLRHLRATLICTRAKILGPILPSHLYTLYGRCGVSNATNIPWTKHWQWFWRGFYVVQYSRLYGLRVRAITATATATAPCVWRIRDIRKW